MIFIGDIALPIGIEPSISYLPASFLSSFVIANLEGAIATPEMVSLSEMKLFSNDNVISFLKACKVRAVSLANNHITDVPSAFKRTKQLLTENRIAFCGAGFNLKEAQSPIMINENDKQTILLAFGWEVIGCRHANHTTLGVNPLTKENVLLSIAETKINYPKAKIIILPHWDYELEQYPMPMHRELAKAAIDAGASAVIGHHPHCVQGIEMYKGCPIAYSLGNWFIPDRVYMKGRTVFPGYSKTELALELNDSSVLCHWFIYDDNFNKVNYVCSEQVENSVAIAEYTPYTGMNRKEYYIWFRKNRLKKKLLPIFTYTDSCIDSKCKVVLVKVRQYFIDVLFQIGIIKRS